MKKTVFDWILYFILFIWQLPQNIVGLVMYLLFKMRGDLTVIDSTKWSTAYSSKYMSGGISLGSFCFLSPRLSQRPPTVAHELKGHTRDSRIFGVFYLLVIGLPSILNAAFDFTRCYYDFWTEKRANKNAGLEVDEHCSLRFKKD